MSHKYAYLTVIAAADDSDGSLQEDGPLHEGKLLGFGNVWFQDVILLVGVSMLAQEKWMGAYPGGFGIFWQIGDALADDLRIQYRCCMRCCFGSRDSPQHVKCGKRRSERKMYGPGARDWEIMRRDTDRFLGTVGGRWRNEKQWAENETSCA